MLAYSSIPNANRKLIICVEKPVQLAPVSLYYQQFAGDKKVWQDLFAGKPEMRRRRVVNGAGVGDRSGRHYFRRDIPF